jgi:hypothetical protein
MFKRKPAPQRRRRQRWRLGRKPLSTYRGSDKGVGRANTVFTNKHPPVAGFQLRRISNAKNVVQA